MGKNKTGWIKFDAHNESNWMNRKGGSGLHGLAGYMDEIR
jgi:hypothetical protein